MAEMAWFNGEIIPLADARVGVEERGFQFADGVYEVIRVYRGKPFTLGEHLARLEQSAEGILLRLPIGRAAIAAGIGKLLAAANLRDGMVYLQATRGESERNHIFPAAPRPSLIAYARQLDPATAPGEGEGVKLLGVPDERWKRCWIKSIALLPNVLAKNQAVAAGFDEAVFIDNGIATECSTSNLFVVMGRKLLTHPVGSKVLPGITRALLLQCATTLGIEVDQRPVREVEMAAATELFISSTTREVSWVARYNDQSVGQGRCGPITLALHRALRERVTSAIDAA